MKVCKEEFSVSSLIIRVSISGGRETPLCGFLRARAGEPAVGLRQSRRTPRAGLPERARR
jgi:hypothetical protein